MAVGIMQETSHPGRLFHRVSAMQLFSVPTDRYDMGSKKKGGRAESG